GWAMAQNRTVKGTVISSEDNEPLIGANVVVVGNATIGAATDLDGNFTLSVPANAKTLRVSYSGMTTKEVAIANVMRIVLDPDSKLLEQVVVLGYGTGQKLSTVSGSVAKVSSEKLAEKPVSNIMDALQGKVAGMQVMTGSGDPTQVAEVRIHGVGSLGASSSPLYIVDGMQTDLGVVATMNPNDFDNVTVLKDASATSIYGARAANGVVIITTKKGKMGEKGQVNFNFSYGVSTIISKKPTTRQMTGMEQLQYQFNNGYWDTTQAGYETIEAVQTTLTNQASTMYHNYQELGELYDSGYLKPVDFTQDADWLKYFIRPTAPTQQGDISFTGGSQGTSYFVSLGYFDQEGISREPSLFRRYSGRMNLESRVKDWLKIGVNLSGAIAESKASSFSGTNYYNTGTFGALSMSKYLNPYTSDGEIAEVYHIPGTTPRQSPLRQAVWYPTTSKTYQANVGGYAQLNPVKGLTLKAQAGLDITDVRATAKTLPNNIYSTNPLGNRTERYSGGRLFTLTNTGEYKTTFDEKHDVTILLGQEFIEGESDAFSARANGFENQKLMLLQQGKTGTFLQLPSQSVSEYAYLSFFGRGSYGFDKWMYLDLSLRNDQSSRFGENNRSAWFYSFGSMFDIYNKFIKESDWLSDLRFKLSYGTTGNSEIGNYNHQALVSNNNYLDNSLGISLSTLGNPDLSWEKQSQLNIGVASGFFNNRLSDEVDFYVRTTNDMLIAVPLQYISGFQYQYQNVGSMRNTGIDVNLTGTIFQNKDWNVYASANFNYNKQEITELFFGLNEYVLPNTSTIWQIGKPNAFYIAEYAGIYKGTQPYTDPDGNVYQGGDQLWYVPGKTWADGTPATTNVYSAELEKPVDKYVTPPVTGGFSLGASWKGLSLDADFAYIIGKWMINNDRFFTENGSEAAMRTNKDKMLLDAWTVDNPNSDVPRIGQDNQFDSRLLENASFLRLKNLKLTYTLPQSVFKSQGVVSGARLYLMARNLLTVTKYKGFDPEAGGNVTLNQFPNTKQFVGGIQITF
ncbi:TonB-linked outer membrane protein RagA, partial [Porphyromonas loveana]|uniref:TonB-linked outer membrane protein RagA n=1 Tax=Porphyromonas loveana TaxID=1884669 RepID=UPI0040396410